YDAEQLTHFVGIQTDVTARIRAAEALVQKQAELSAALTELEDTQTMLVHAEKMNPLGRMAAAIAHVINNPLSFVNSNLYSLQGMFRDLIGSYERLEHLITVKATQLLNDTYAIRREGDIDFIVNDVEDMLKSSLDGLQRVKH